MGYVETKNRTRFDARRVQALETLVAEFSENDMEEYFPDLDAPDLHQAG